MSRTCPSSCDRRSFVVRIAAGRLSHAVVRFAARQAISRRTGLRGLRWSVVDGGLEEWRCGDAEVIASRCVFCGGAVLFLPWYTAEDIERADGLVAAMRRLRFFARWVEEGEYARIPDYVCRECFATRCRSRRSVAVRLGLPLARAAAAPKPKRAAVA